MNHKISTLTGVMLELAVATLSPDVKGDAKVVLLDGELAVIDSSTKQRLSYTSDKSMARAILAKQKFELKLFNEMCDGQPEEWICFDRESGRSYMGHSMYVAGLRCYVSSVLKAYEIDLPCLTVGFLPGYVPMPEHVERWLDRVGNMELISDAADHETMKPDYYWSAVRDHDRHHGLTEAAVWWM